MARLTFDNAPESVPYDADQEIVHWSTDTAWGPLDHTAYVPGFNEHARGFDGGAGYVGEDQENIHLGHLAVTVRTILAIDYNNAAGEGPMVIAGRGSGGATAGEYWAWLIQAEVDGSGSTEFSIAWQDSAGVLQTVVLGSVDRPPDGTWLYVSVCRERSRTGFECRLNINGDEIGATTVTHSITATPGEPISIGTRANAALNFDRFLYASVQRIEILNTAVTALQERHRYRELMVAAAASLSPIRELWVDLPELRLHDSNYEATVLKPLAAVAGDVQIAGERRLTALLPPHAYGEALERWERSLGIQPGPLDTVAERQERARVLTALVEGLTPEAMRAYAARLTGADLADVSVHWCSNDFLYDLERIITYASDIGDRDQLEGARVSGNIDCSWTGSALLVQPVITTGGSGEYHSPANEFGAGFTEWAVDPNERASIYARMKPDPSNPTSISRWVGLCMRRGNHVFWVAASESFNNLYAYQSSGGNSITVTDLGTLPASASGTWDITIMYEDLVRESSDCPLRVRVKAAEDGIDDWQETTVNAALPDSPQWMGFSLVMGITINVETEIQELRLQWRDRPSSFSWSAVVSSGISDPVQLSRDLNIKNRASAVATMTVDPELLADSPDSYADFTPTLCPAL